MPSTYTTSLRTEQMATGENRSTWGTKANEVFQLLEDAVVKQITIALTDANYTLTTANGDEDEARCAGITFTGTLTANRTVTIPGVDKIYLMFNNTTGGKTLIVSNGTSTVNLESGVKCLIFNDNTDIWRTFDLVAGTSGAKVPLLNTANTWSAAQAFSSASIDTPLPLSSGGTGGATAADARAGLGLGSLSTVNSPLPVANGGTGSTTAAAARTALGTNDASTLTAGTLPDTRLSGNVAMTNVNEVFTGTVTVNSNFSTGGSVTSNGYFTGSGVNTLLSTTGAGTIYFRPNGQASATGQTYINSAGNMIVAGDITVSGGNITGTASNASALSGATLSQAATGNTVVQRSAQGYVYGAYFNSSHAVSAPGAASAFFAETGSDGFARKITPAAAADVLGVLGVGQSWQDVSASRVLNTSYRNTTGRPIQVSISVNKGAGASATMSIQVSTDNVNWTKVVGYGGYSSGGGWTFSSMIIPNNVYYRASDTGSGSNITGWAELR